MFLKNKNIIFKIKRSKVTDYAALRQTSFSRTFQESPLNSSTFQASGNPEKIHILAGLSSSADWFESYLVQNLEDRLLVLRPKWAVTGEKQSSGFPTKRDSNQPAQLQRLARKLKFSL